MSVIGYRKCKCVMSTRDKTILKFVDIVGKEARCPPIFCEDAHDWANFFCPECKGAGYIREEAVTQREQDALRRDFDNRRARR